MASITRIRADHEVTWTRSITTWSKLIPLFCSTTWHDQSADSEMGPFPFPDGGISLLLPDWDLSLIQKAAEGTEFFPRKRLARSSVFFLIGWSLDIRSMWKIKCLLSIHFLLFNLIVRFSISGAFVHYKNKSSYKYRKEIWIFGLFFMKNVFDISQFLRVKVSWACPTMCHFCSRVFWY